ncbi:fatty acid kinase FakB1 [Staphylococcus aureus]|nr:fatty acid kinase FakB1 [Staphylococcus aureus]MBR8866997.1 fatty acid kinase FakB1 [Staphylococcus aureus]MBR8874480.1 fatty acid kinase FakB1 [Staphylococcus aureus]MBR8993090.1 fatty acid kinase FakB1 [Staphylococcus aureus]MBR9591042.1 fatty acid kinase FakB1 [Staphylococcus aureus]
MKIAVMTDSTSYLSQDLIDKYNIQIAPLSVTFDDGKIIPEEKVRTKKRAIQTLEKKVLDIVKDFEEVTLFVINGDHLEDGQALYKKLQEDCPSAYQVAYSEFGPVVAAHLGSGGLGLGYVGRKIRLT